MFRLFVVCLALFAIPTLAGVTIHYEGRAKDQEAVAVAITTARSFAQQRSWRIDEATASKTSLTMYPHPMCEPVTLHFNGLKLNADSVKTQFAGIEAHLQVVALFKRLEPQFGTLKVLDEGGYWDSGQLEPLQRLMDNVNTTLKNTRRMNPEAKGPVKLANGRIVDVATP